MFSEFYHMQLNYLLKISNLIFFIKEEYYGSTINFLSSNDARGLRYKPDKLLLLLWEKS